MAKVGGQKTEAMVMIVAIVEGENIKDLLSKLGIGEMMDLNTPGTTKLWALDIAEIIMKSTLSKENIQYLVLALMD